MKKKIFMLFVITILVIVLSACGGKDGNNENVVENDVPDVVSAAETQASQLYSEATATAIIAEAMGLDEGDSDVDESNIEPSPSATQTPILLAKDEEVDVLTGCPQARDLGPWAPNNGLGEDFEVTCNETNCAGTHVQLWWPGGSGEDWDEEEISVLVPPGLSVEVQDGAGKGWEYALTCSMDEIDVQMEDDHERRMDDTAYWGVVNIDDLIDTGLVEVRFDRRK